MSYLNYTTIHHDTRKLLGLSANEYMIADLIYNLQNNLKSKFPGFCYATREKLGDMLGISRSGIKIIIGRLEKEGLIEVDTLTHYMKTTQEWYEKVVCIHTNDMSGQKVATEWTKSSHAVDKKCPPKPGYDNNRNNNTDNNHSSDTLDVAATVVESPENIPAISQTIGHSDIIREIMEHFRKESKTNIKDTDKKVKSIDLRLKKFSKDEILTAISNTFANPFFSGTNDRGWVADFDYVFRSDDNMDKMLNLKGGKNVKRVKIM